jgi:hypothetical protein
MKNQKLSVEKERKRQTLWKESASSYIVSLEYEKRKLIQVVKSPGV